jgi:hypothetical protein
VATTVGDLILASLRLIGELAEAETPSAATANDALSAFNQMVDSWSTERLSVYCTQDQVFTWPANVASRTVGPTGDFVGLRPVTVDSATYFRDPSNGLSYLLQFLNQEQYNSIPLKSSQSTYPETMWVNMTHPNATMTVYPVPSRPLEFHIVSVLELAQPAVLATELIMPPGYRRALKFNLGLEICAEFGIDAPREVKRIAMISKRNIKRINNPDDLLQMPAAMVTAHNRYNIFVGV